MKVECLPSLSISDVFKPTSFIKGIANDSKTSPAFTISKTSLRFYETILSWIFQTREYDNLSQILEAVSIKSTKESNLSRDAIVTSARPDAICDWSWWYAFFTFSLRSTSVASLSRRSGAAAAVYCDGEAWNLRGYSTLGGSSIVGFEFHTRSQFSILTLFSSFSSNLKEVL